MGLSAMVPVYYVMDFLEICVSSILANDFRVCKIILANDGPTDGVNSGVRDWQAE